MKTISLIAALSLAVAHAHAQSADCAIIGDLAQAIMEVRQSGVPMSDAMRISGDNDAIRAIVIAAYSYPRFRTERVKSEAIADFRNEFELMCYGTST